jgi:hypothetical protein
MQTAGYTRADLINPAYEAEHGFNVAYEAALERAEAEAVANAKAYLAGNKSALEKSFYDADLAQGMDVEASILAMLLVGAKCPARETLLHALCHAGAHREAMEA